MSTSTGYDDDKSEDKFVGEQRWTLEEYQSPSTGVFKTGILVVREDENRSVRGHISFKTIEELNWLKKRIDGGRRVDG